MKQLEKYCSSICNINGLMTYVISPEYYDTIPYDVDLLQSLFKEKADIERLIKEVKKIKTERIFISFTYHKTWMERYRWMPALCYKHRQDFYHVQYHSGWICRECGHNNGAVIMPMLEADAVYYRGTSAEYPPIPPMFKNIPCKNCGRMLQNHLIQISN